jgi:nicotinate dehydrogenase subunit A
MQVTLDFRVNEARVSVAVEGSTPLLYVLRNDLNLMGTRFGCGDGDCGACTVLIDGVDAHSCQITVDQAVGRAVTTVEGLVDVDGRPGRVQRALIDHRAGQCGYCLSGIVMRLESGLRQSADRAGLIEMLVGNLCRCGAHARILRAVDDLLAGLDL